MRQYNSAIIKFTGILVSVILLISSAASWQIFNHHPDSVHQWRQSDCASYVKTYYRNNTGLFTPGTFNLGGKHGRVVSEFPIIYYLAAKIELITGENYWVSRGLTFLCYIIGLLSLLACIRKWIPQYFYASVPVILLATSPYYPNHAIEIEDN